MIVAHIFVTILVITLSFNLIELSCAFPFASGCASYARAAFGPAASCLIGYSYALELEFQGI